MTDSALIKNNTMDDGDNYGDLDGNAAGDTGDLIDDEEDKKEELETEVSIKFWFYFSLMTLMHILLIIVFSIT